MAITRRVFMRNGAMVAVGTGLLPGFLGRVAYADPAAKKSVKRLVVVFQRGAADGLNIVVPHGEKEYYAVRPSINIPRNAVLDLDGFFGLHPSMTAFQTLWREKHLAIVHAAGSPDPTRSHFDAQDFMESGLPGVKGTQDGWLNRAVHSTPGDRATAFRAVAMGTVLPRILLGPEPAVAVEDIRNFGVGKGASASAQTSAFEAMYDHASDGVLQGTGQETLEAVRMLKSADPSRYTPAAGANYPAGHLGDSLKQLAQLIKANLGVQVGFADMGGWDHHVHEGNTVGLLARMTQEFSQALGAFWIDLGNLMEETVVVTMSEFGRTVKENGNRGTDHGHANVMFAIGGPVRGGKVYGRWPGLDHAQLYEGRDLAVTTDFRRVVGEAVQGHLGSAALAEVFPGFDNNPDSFVGYLRPRGG